MFTKEQIQHQLERRDQSPPFWRFCALMANGRVVTPFHTPEVFLSLKGEGTPSRLFLSDYRNRGAIHQIKNIGVLHPTKDVITWARIGIDEPIDYQFSVRKIAEIGDEDSPGVKLWTAFLSLQVTYTDQVILTRIQDETGCQLEANRYFRPDVFEQVVSEMETLTLQCQVNYLEEEIARVIQIKNQLAHRYEQSNIRHAGVEVLTRLRIRLTEITSKFTPHNSDSEAKQKRIIGGNLKSEIASLLMEAGYQGDQIVDGEDTDTWMPKVQQCGRQVQEFIAKYGQ